MIKPIETTFNGMKYRSRLEARWAVFLTELGEPFEYEPEGYHLPPLPEECRTSFRVKDGQQFPEMETYTRPPTEIEAKRIINYVPDIWLPREETFIEIKPNLNQVYEDSIVYEKLARLNYHTGYRTILLMGTPKHESIGSAYPQPGDTNCSYCGVLSGEGVDFPYLWCECKHCDRIGIEFDGRSARLRCGCEKTNKAYNTDTPRLINAFHKASTYRFDW